MKAIIVKEFNYKGRKCVIAKIDLSQIRKTYKKLKLKGHKLDYHNGYIELKKKEVKKDYSEYNINVEEITYQGKLEHLGIKTESTFIGFDTAHYYNDENPKSKSLESVEKQCKKIVMELSKT